MKIQLSGGPGCGCLGFILTGLVGGWLLEYDLNHWVPVLHKLAPGFINNAGPFHMSFLMWCAGFPLGAPAFTVAIITFFLTTLGIIN